MLYITCKKKSSLIILFSIFMLVATVSEAKLFADEYSQAKKECKTWFISASTTGTISIVSLLLLVGGPAYIFSIGFIDTFKNSTRYAVQFLSELFPSLWWTVPLGGITGGVSLVSFFKYRECQKNLTLKKALEIKEVGNLKDFAGSV